MKFTDKKALSILNRLKCSEARESIETFPEDERDGKSDMQIIADEINYFRCMYDEEGDTTFSESLEWARKCLRDTENGKVMPMHVGYDTNGKIHFIEKYNPWDADNAKRIVAEYKQLCYYDKKLN